MHVAIIMDGNGRWALRRGLPRTAGHRAGAKAVKSVVEAAARGPVEMLTLYAFSADNWSRPGDEVENLMRLLERYLAAETARCVEQGVRLVVIGRRDRLGPRLTRAIRRAETLTRHGRRLVLRLAVDYSARALLSDAARGPGALCDALAASVGADGDRACLRHALEVDLLIRTGGEQRLSDFLLWECAYAELLFVPTLWPDFDAESFDTALAEFSRRERRFGGLPTPDTALRARDAT